MKKGFCFVAAMVVSVFLARPVLAIDVMAPVEPARDPVKFSLVKKEEAKVAQKAKASHKAVKKKTVTKASAKKKTKK